MKMTAPPDRDDAAGSTATGAGAAPSIVSLRGITKSFGPTLANAGIDLTVNEGDIVGLVGGNGAGKSTLMRILAGAIWPTLGELACDGVPLPFSEYDASDAQRRGIRMVHQELSLCTNLSVAENFFLETPAQGSWRPGWRRAYAEKARAALDVVFPNSRIDAAATVGHLTLAERQMVEIARAVSTPGVRVVVLDEPTSSLGPERSRQLLSFVRAEARKGLAFIFISHKLQEVLDIATRVSVLRNGHLAWEGDVRDASIDHLVQMMGGNPDLVHAHGAASPAAARPARISIASSIVRSGEAITLHAGEVVGLAGLEGSGQKEFLHALFEPVPGGPVTRQGAAGFIPGDRQKEGVFPLWTVLSNISIGRIAWRKGLGFVSDRQEEAAAGLPASRLRLDRSRLGAGILDLSGGNQQKALVARALVADAPILLLDDPTRGVDIATKQDFYKLCADIASDGRTLVWHTTEDAELLAADRVLVFSNGQIVRELSGDAITEEAIVAASFEHASEAGTDQDDFSGRPLRGSRLIQAAPFIGLAAVFAVMAWANPSIASVFGLDLLLMPAFALVLVAVAQMFVVGGSEIDLGVGAFAGLVSVLAATLLPDRPALGGIAIVLAIAAYACLGGLIQARKIPAIVVTLGASFIWLGIGYSLQPTPGGTSPDWLSALFGWSFSNVPTSVILIAGAALVALALDRSPLGVVLRGFGNNPAAMVRSGWPPTRYAMVRYLIAALFAAAAGLSLTAVNTASDINSGSSYTLLSVAAVVMGGCSLIGGITSPVGAVAGAVTLSLIGALLGALNVSSDFNPATQGLVLITLLVLRGVLDRDEDG